MGLTYSSSSFPPPFFFIIIIIIQWADMDVHKLIQSPQHLSWRHVQSFGYQLLKGVRFMQSAGVIHRDLKPASELCCWMMMMNALSWPNMSSILSCFIILHLIAFLVEKNAQNHVLTFLQTFW
jgi:hypothetical protein